ncbi:MAG: hypothetical protein WC465_04940 [Patescibacteria group bacterium]
MIAKIGGRAYVSALIDNKQVWALPGSTPPIRNNMGEVVNQGLIVCIDNDGLKKYAASVGCKIVYSQL